MQLNWVCIHESAHAVIGERLGQSVTAITCVPGRGYGGYVACATAQVPADASGLRKLRLRLRAEGLTSLAGPIGQAYFTHEPISSTLKHCGGDRRAAYRCTTGYALALPQWSADTRYQIFDDWLEETKGLVHTNWPTIVALAERLALNGTLGPADVCRIIMLADRAAA
jgi:hypothetical protein